jgi:hypothetical protein
VILKTTRTVRLWLRKFASRSRKRAVSLYPISYPVKVPSGFSTLVSNDHTSGVKDLVEFRRSLNSFSNVKEIIKYSCAGKNRMDFGVEKSTPRDKITDELL